MIEMIPNLRQTQPKIGFQTDEAAPVAPHRGERCRLATPPSGGLGGLFPPICIAPNLLGRASRFTHHVLRPPFYLALLMILTLLVLLTWFFSARDDGTLAEIQRRGTLRVGLDASFPPFETVDDQGQIVGLDVDLARAMAADLGVELEPVNIGFDGLYDALLARRVDLIISGLPYDPRWTQDVAYTANYFNAGQVLVVRADEARIKAGEDLAGRTVAVEWGSQAEMEGRRLAREIADRRSGNQQSSEVSQTSELSTGLTLLRRETAAEALAALFEGQAEAAIVDGVSGVSAVPRGLRIVAYLTDEWYAAAVHIESQALLRAVNQSLARLEESGQMAELQARWLHGQ